jgi:hypothetical protein
MTSPWRTDALQLFDLDMEVGTNRLCYKAALYDGRQSSFWLFGVRKAC